ncbi:MAG: nicotinate-nucleotide--dimethylbenzimidazole phosphoribosyltransferase, partial [Mitsuokella jalaludinii]|nr:nicotinate-nucleotide--dimethylbenzimidazole phosphoribosyltransferase [Mitsuokella jalaludinii]
MNAFHEQLAQISLAEILPKIEAPGSATSRRARPLLEAHLRSMGAVEQDLGQLAPLFLRWLDISGTMDPKPPRKAVVICCADHGVAAEGVSAYPQETTLEM